MEDNVKSIESLLDRAVEYGKTSYELIKLKALEKTSDVVSSLIPGIAIFIFIASFVVFVNLGLAFWLGDILGKTYYGFFVIAAFYVIAGIVLRLFMHKWIKKQITNYFLKQVLK